METASPQHRPLAGFLWMVVSGLNFVAVTALVKYVGAALPAAEAAFLRYGLGIVFLVPMLGAMRRARMTRRQLWLFAGRGGAHTLAVILWFFAMARIPMAEVTALNYLNPVYVTLGAGLFLGERLSLRRLAAVAFAFGGAMIVLRPGLREIAPGHLAMLGTAAMFAVSYLLAKQLSGEVRPVVVVGMLSLTVTIGLAPFAAAVWVPPTLWQCAVLFVVACFATAGHFAMTLAFAAAPVSVTQPASFLQLIWSVAVGALFFAEAVDGWVVLGGVVIVSAVSFIAWREARLGRAITPSAPQTDA